jgi:hypothetical protein
VDAGAADKGAAGASDGERFRGHSGRARRAFLLLDGSERFVREFSVENLKKFQKMLNKDLRIADVSFHE